MRYIILKKLRPVFLPLILFFVFSSLVSADSRIIFSDLDLSDTNRLLFRAGSPRGDSIQDALFLARLSQDTQGGGFPVQQLSAFPERMELLESGRVLQVRNAFGAVRITLPAGLPMPIPGLPSFAAGNADVIGRVKEMASSADGRWLLYIDPVSPAFGNLILLDVFSGARTQIASRLERPERQFPASWSPDSRLFIYERSGILYYYMIGSAPMPPGETLRRIGEGTINSIYWGRDGDFFYLNRSILYRVRTSELAARSFLAGFINIGVQIGRLPFDFDPFFDNFWIASDARSLIVSKGRRNLFYYTLAVDPMTVASVLPHLSLPRFCTNVEVLWPAGGAATVLVSGKQTGTRAWRLQPGTGFIPLPLPPASFASGSLSPDGQLALLWGDGGILLYNYANWQLLATLSIRPAMSCLWVGNNEIITGDDQRIERVRLVRTPALAIAGRELICLSGAEQVAFEVGAIAGGSQAWQAAGARILAGNSGAWFVTDGRSPWTPLGDPRPRSPSRASAMFRVYLENQSAGPYANLPMIRNIANVGTFPLFPRHAAADARIRPGHNRIALTFDLYDDDHGLPETLDALNRLGIRATFFLNGEFIRRHPESTIAIASAGHESASMFFAPIDLSDARFLIGGDFITQGLARNEDEFYRVTGKELALLWHAPWYITSPEITAAAALAGYITVGRDIDPLDWVRWEDTIRLGLPQRSPAEMVDHIVAEVRPGYIVPIRLGLLPGGRNGYLFHRINVLLDALVREGYTLTTVSRLIDYQVQNR